MAKGKGDGKKPTPEKSFNQRKNGKAWKKGADGVSAEPDKRIKKVRVRTPERIKKDEMIRAHRQHRREQGIARAAQRRADEAEARRLAVLEGAQAESRTAAVKALKKAAGAP